MSSWNLDFLNLDDKDKLGMPDSKDSQQPEKSPRASPLPDSSQNSEPITTDATTQNSTQNKPQMLPTKADRRQGPSPITVKLSDNVVNVGKKQPKNAAGDGPSQTAGDSNPGNKISGKKVQQSTAKSENQTGVPTVSEVMEQVAKVTKVTKVTEEAPTESESKAQPSATEEAEVPSEKKVDTRKMEDEDEDEDGLAQMEKAAESLMAVIDEVSCQRKVI